jgi:aspartate aminotransferase
MPELAKRTQNLTASATMAMQKRANALRAEGTDVVDFGIGEPDFATPDSIKRAAEEALEKNYTKYTSAGGTAEARAAVAEKYKRDYGATFDPKSEIVVSCGAKQALYNAVLALFEEGDEVMLPAPYWVTYPDQIEMAGAKVVVINTSEANDFSLTATEVESAITDRTKAIILNFPNNPSGAVIADEEIEKIVALARTHDFYVIFDECYEHFVYDGKSISAAPFGKENVLLIGSCSKTYAMTGWRIGWAAGSSDIIKVMENLQSQATSNPNSIAQWAASKALTGDQSSIPMMLGEYRKRRDVIVEGLNNLPGVTCIEPKGSFYVFPNISGRFGETIKDSDDFVEHLLNEAAIVSVSGIEFGMDGYIRLSYATSLDRINEGLRRMNELLA